MPTHKPRRAAIYARVSSERQDAPDKASIQTQLAECRALATKNGDSVAVEYVDAKRYHSESTGRIVEPSAKRADRPEWKKMLAAAGKEWDVLYAWRSDRICRGNETTGMFERVLDERRIGVELVTQTFDRDTFGLLSGGVGGYELRNISVRMLMGRNGRAKDGLYLGKTPIGYEWVRDDSGRVINFRVRPEWRPFFDQLAELFLAQVPFLEMGRRLGRRFNGGKAWAHNRVRDFILSDFYRGILVYGRNRPAPDVIRRDRARHSAAWDEATIAAIDAEWARRKRLGRHGPRHALRTYLFAGLIVCGHCGRNITADGKMRASGNFYFRYTCQTRWTTDPNHVSLSFGEEAVVAFLRQTVGQFTAAQLDRFLELQQAAQAPITGQAAAEAEYDQLEARAADLRRAIDRLGDVSPVVTAGLVLDLEEVERQAKDVKASTALITVQQSQADRLRLRQAMLRLVAALPDLERLDRLEAQAIVRAAIPRLIVTKHGNIPQFSV